MAISYLSVNAAAGQSAGVTTPAGTASITPTMPGSTTNGQSRVFVVSVATGTQPAYDSNWTQVFRNTVIGSGTVAAGSGQRYMSMYYRDKDSGWSTIPAVALDSATQLSHWVGAVAINKTSTSHTWDTPTVSTAGSDFGTANTSHSATTGSLTTHALGFLLIPSVVNDNVTSTTGALAQTGATFGTVTERCDGGTATGNDVAGSVHTCSVTTGATAALTFTATLSAASEGGTIVVEQREAGPKVDTITEAFATKDTAKWGWAGTSNAVSGQLSLPVVTANANNIYSQMTYDFTGSSICCEFAQPPNASDGSTQASFRLDTQTGILFDFSWINNTLYFYETDSVTAAYSATDHRWLRLRESAGTVYWDTSPDGITWTNRRSKAHSTTITTCYVRFMVTCGASAPTPGTALYDNVNLAPAGNPAEFFAMF